MPIQADTAMVLIGSGEILLGAAISVAGMLATNESVTGTPTMTVTPSNAPDATPTATSAAASSTILTINGVDVPAGQAIQFTLTGNSAAKKNYTVTVTFTTSAGSTMQCAVNFRII